MDLNGPQWIAIDPWCISLDPNVSQWIPKEPNRPQWIPMDSKEYWWIQLDLNVSPWIPIDPNGSKWIQNDAKESLRPPKDLNGSKCICLGFPGMSQGPGEPQSQRRKKAKQSCSRCVFQEELPGFEPLQTAPSNSARALLGKASWRPKDKRSCWQLTARAGRSWRVRALQDEASWLRTRT